MRQIKPNRFRCHSCRKLVVTDDKFLKDCKICRSCNSKIQASNDRIKRIKCYTKIEDPIVKIKKKQGIHIPLEAM